MQLYFRFDVGPVLHQSKLSLDPHIKRPELTTILAQIGADTLAQVITDLEQYKKNPIKQDESKAILSPKLKPEMAEFDWERKNSVEIYNLYRGLYGVYKLKTNFLDKKVDLDNLALVSIEDKSNICDKNVVNDHIYIVKDSAIFPSSAIPGQIIFKHDNLFVKCSESLNSKYLSYISVGKVKLGNKWMSAKDFQNGFLSKCKPEQRVFRHRNVVECNKKSVFSTINQ
jgi:methionyl-tRNA formyltransferase